MKNVTLSGEMPRRNVIGRFVDNNSKTIVEVIAALFILLFLYTALSKTYDISKTEGALQSIALLAPFAEIISWTIVILEYMISALLFIPKTRNFGLYASLCLMICFTGYITFLMLFIPDLPCSCGGILSKMSWSQHLVTNIIFTTLSLIAIIINKYNPRIKLDT